MPAHGSCNASLCTEWCCPQCTAPHKLCDLRTPRACRRTWLQDGPQPFLILTSCTCVGCVRIATINSDSIAVCGAHAASVGARKIAINRLARDQGNMHQVKLSFPFSRVRGGSTRPVVKVVESLLVIHIGKFTGRPMRVFVLYQSGVTFRTRVPTPDVYHRFPFLIFTTGVYPGVTLWADRCKAPLT